MSNEPILDDRTQKHIGSLIEALRDLVGRFANEDGVEIDYNTRLRNWIRFRLRTPDNFALTIEYDINQTSKDYIDNMMEDTIQRLDQARRKRHESPIIVTGVQ